MWGLEGDSVSATDLKSLRNILTVTMISKISDPVISNPVMAATTFDNRIIWSIRGYNTSSLPNRSSQTVIEQGNIWWQRLESPRRRGLHWGFIKGNSLLTADSYHVAHIMKWIFSFSVHWKFSGVVTQLWTVNYRPVQDIGCTSVHCTRYSQKNQHSKFREEKNMKYLYITAER